jgi:hypothetical protein
MTALMPVVGLAIGGLAMLFHAITGKDVSMVLFSGQDQMPQLLQQGVGWSVGVLLAIVACKSLAYALSLSCFRGGPIFPALFIGAAGGIAASHLPGLDLVPAVAMGIGVMSCTMLNLPLTSTLLATLLLGKDGVQAMPVVIVAVAVAYIVTARLTPVEVETPAAAPAEAQPARV